MQRAALVLIAGCGRIAFDNVSGDGGCPASSGPVLAVNAGEKHTCGLDTNGAVYCAGNNAEGTFGDGTRTSSLTVVRSKLPKAIKVVTGSNFTCALDDTQSVWCWGGNQSGQLGTGSFMPTSSPDPVRVNIDNVTDVEAYFLHACARLADRSVWCWGNNARGQLGTGLMNGSPSPVQVPGLPPTDSLAEGGRQHMCVVANGGELWCWGQNDSGQVGDSMTTDRNLPFQVPGIANAVQAAVGTGITCARLSDDRTVCLGRGVEGRLGDGTENNHQTPTSVLLPEPLVELDAGNSHVCGRTASNRMVCWGSNDHGEMGTGGRGDQLTPIYVDAIGTVSQISAGQFYSCAMHSDGTAACWGDNEDGQLANGLISSIAQPTETFAPAYGAIDVVAGSFGTCVSNADGIACAGDNQYGILGDGTFVDRDTFAPVTGVPPGSRLASCASCSAMCAVTPSATVLCWGLGTTGVIGDGQRITTSTPLQAAGLANVAFAGVGDTHACAVRNDGAMFCWGSNGLGQLGDGTQMVRTVPTQVVGLPGPVLAFAAGAQHTCAISGGQLLCWGSGADHRLGDNMTTGRTAPSTADPTLTGGNLTAVALTETSGCVLDNVGDLRCWGSGGRHGGGFNGDANTPTLVLQNTTVVDGGTSHTCAVKTDKTVWCWGDCTRGKCGPQSTGTEIAPTQVVGVTDALAVTAGETHTCIKHESGAISCFGGNSFGQLGLPPVLTRSPTPVCAP